MRTSTRILAGIATSAALTLVVAVPAMAVPGPPESTVTAEVTGGSLTITAPASTILNSAAPGLDASGSLQGVSVTDERAIEGTWTASYSITDFTSTTTDAVIPSDAFEINAVVPTATTGTIDLETFTRTGAGPSAVASATVVGNNSATWVEGILVHVPAGALAGVYTATLTHSVL
ncbi:hypothetical protein [Herbiconiux sp.]|uniref:hypothetical protein n=1 Tax=Herbiconiux sp. TaxID=1871186 RepID=UPI0025BEB8B4|nr:hypothetical protein [Herbiconiux sp.]